MSENPGAPEKEKTAEKVTTATGPAGVSASMRGQIWGALVNTKFKGFCLDLLVEHFQRMERNMNIFLALVSSGSIAAWAVWKMFPIIWGGIIAASQILTAIKPFIPYFKFVKELNPKSSRMDSLFIDFERLWYKVEHKKISDDEAAETYFKLKGDTEAVLNFADDTIVEATEKIKNTANLRMKIYFKTHYDVEINLNQ